MLVKESSKTRNVLLRSFMASTAIIALCSVSMAHAQTEGETEEARQKTVVVTGTSVRGQAPIGSTVEMVDEELIRESGQANTTDLLRTIPAVSNLGLDEGRGGGVQRAQVNVSQAKTLNLRGLGAESNLVLMNGRRIIPAGTTMSGYDVSALATRGINRIEVVADGSSAIYGSDAVSGVVNLITHRDYEGVELYFRQGYAEGFTETRFGGAAGYDWGSGQAFFTYDRYDRGGIMQSDREEIFQDLRAFGGPDLRQTFSSPGNILANGTTYAIPRGQDGTLLMTGNFAAGTQNRTDESEFKSLLVNQEQDNFIAYVEQDLSENFKVWGEGYYSDRNYTGSGDSLSSGFGRATLTVPDTNPWFVHPTDPNATSVTIRYGFGDLIPPNTEGGENPWQIAGGFEWGVFGDWVAEGHLSYGENIAYRLNDKLRSGGLAAALSDPNPATAFNPFCDATEFTCAPQATIDTFKSFLLIQGEFDQTDAVVKASGPLFSIPGGDVSAAFGVEYLENSLTTTVHAAFVGRAPRITTASREVSSVFAEVAVPIVGSSNAVSGVQELDAVFALRHDDYSDFGTTTNPKIGVNWRPVENLKFRGTYGTSFRAPTLGEIDAEATRTFTLSTPFDPVQGQTIQAILLLGAGDRLGPEEATTYTLGFDWEPVSGLNTSLTYYDIDYQNRIAAVDAGTILNNQSLFMDRYNTNPTDAEIQAIYDSPFYRDQNLPYSSIDAIIEARSGNLNVETQKGIDGSITYDFSALESDWLVGANFTKILEAEQEQLNGLISADILDVINNPVDLRARAFGSWDYENVRVIGFVNYVDGYTNDLVTPSVEVDNWITLDLSGSITAPDSAPDWLQGTRFSVNITNATDEDPPFALVPVAQTAGIYDSQNASVIGRMVSFEISKKW